MQKTAILERIEKEKIMAIVRVETLERAHEIVAGCLAGEISCLEISYTNHNAGEIIQQLNKDYGDQLLLGAGTVLDSETARLAILAGAQFIIAPNFNEAVCRLCNRYQIPYMPGCTSMTEVVQALEAGAAMIKGFPISNYYGPSLVNAIKTPMPFVPILSSGGATLANVSTWLETGIECVGIGSLLTKGTQAEISSNAIKLRAAVNNYQK